MLIILVIQLFNPLRFPLLVSSSGMTKYVICHTLDQLPGIPSGVAKRFNREFGCLLGSFNYWYGSVATGSKLFRKKIQVRILILSSKVIFPDQPISPLLRSSFSIFGVGTKFNSLYAQTLWWVWAYYFGLLSLNYLDYISAPVWIISVLI